VNHRAIPARARARGAVQRANRQSGRFSFIGERNAIGSTSGFAVVCQLDGDALREF